MYDKIGNIKQKGVNYLLEYHNRIRDLREDRELNQTEIAKILNITQQQYSIYENGKRDIPTKLLIKLAKYYGVSIDYLLGLTNTPTHFRKD